MRRPDAERPVHGFDGAWREWDALPPLEASPEVHAGVGVFETLGVRGTAVLDLGAHLDRLERAASTLGVALPPRGGTAEAILAVASGERAARGWVKLVAIAGGPTVVFGGSIDPGSYGAPCSAVVLPWARHSQDPIVGIKTTSWASAVRGLAEAARRGADEGLWRNQRGHLTEACGANLFVVRKGALYTAAPRDGILAGIVRAHVLAAAKASGMRVHEGKLRERRLCEADEAFLTSAVRGVRPLVALDGSAVGSGRPGAWTRRLGDEAERLRAESSRRRADLDGASATG